MKDRNQLPPSDWDDCFACGGSGVDPEYLSYSCEVCDGIGQLAEQIFD